MLLGGDLCGDDDPASGLQSFGLFIPAGNAAELNIVHAAGHDAPAQGRKKISAP